ncbi:Hypothetical predicted protein [Mytilus galloprovincialis]|uniref:Uncharacterized protein n=1 Tax=Mytilus galloprovincialis TaxID=29158 RepID=A0A8B6C0Q7_MYTGA|nr:Hypothetical predicted protein [Mytilus galloprovincialis]
MVRTSHLTKLDIVRLYRNSYTIRDIRAALNSKGIKVTRQVIDYWVQQYRLGKFTDEITCPPKKKKEDYEDTNKSRSTSEYRRFYQVRPSLPKPKHPIKVHVWAGISKRGTTPILIFDGIMNGQFFTYNILRDTFLSYVRRKFPDQHRFHMDNDPKHRSKVSKDFMTSNGINLWDVWPSVREVYLGLQFNHASERETNSARSNQTMAVSSTTPFNLLYFQDDCGRKADFDKMAERLLFNKNIQTAAMKFGIEHESAAAAQLYSAAIEVKKRNQKIEDMTKMHENSTLSNQSSFQ